MAEVTKNDDDLEQEQRPKAGSLSGWEASEWGPAEQVPAEDTEWGWAEESRKTHAVNNEYDEIPESFAAEDDDRWDDASERRRSNLRASTSMDSGDEEDYEDSIDNSYKSERYEPGVGETPDIALLSAGELDRVLPVVPFSAQAAFFNGGPTQALQRWGASLALTVLLRQFFYQKLYLFFHYQFFVD